MSKSQETWNKKEREKKRIKAKNEKLERKQWRKENPQNVSDIAYVDEHGNLTSTPPDPSKRIQINAEDIEIGIPKFIHEETQSYRTGIVTFFNESKGFGFIVDTETKESIFVHISALKDRVSENNRVQFEIEKGARGANAINVKLEK